MFNIFADGQIIYQPGNDNLSLLSPKLTVEMGKAGSLEFSVPPTNRFYNDLYQIRTKLVVTSDGEEIFRGRVLSNKRSFNNVKEVYGEGDLSFLVDSCQKAKKYEGKAHALFRSIISEHNRMIQSPEKQFTVGQITVEDRSVVLKGQSDEIEDLETHKFNYRQIAINSIAEEWQNTYDYIESVLLDYCGGYLRTRYDSSSGKTYIDWMKDYYAEATQTIQLGKNLLDLSEEITAEDLFTVLIPLGDENLTIEKVNNGSIELADADAVAKYGRIVKTNVFDGVTKPETLLENARRYLKNHVEVPITYEIKAVDLHLINPSTRAIFVGDKVHVLSPAHEIDKTDLVCTKIEYDLTNPANTTYTFGNPKQDLTERYRKNKKNDASRGGGGGGAAAKKAEESSDANTREIYDAWVKFDPENATIDIGALFEKLNPGLDKTQIYSKAQILMGANADGSNINLLSEFDSAIDNISNQAGITIDTNPDRPELNIFVNDKKTGNSASINLGIDYDKTVTIDEDHIAHVHYEPKSKIAFNSDIVEINTKVFNLNTEVAKIAANKVLELSAPDIKALCDSFTISGVVKCNKSFNASGGSFDDNLVYQHHEINLHCHKITVLGDGHIQIGNAVDCWQAQSFNIADTAFYKNMVSALTIKDITADFSTSYKSRCRINVKALNASKESKYEKEIVNQFQPSYMTWECVENSKTYSITVKPVNITGSYITAPSGNGFRAYTTNSNIYNKGYNAGKGSVEVSSISATFHSSNGVRLYVVLSNGNTSYHNVSY